MGLAEAALASAGLAVLIGGIARWYVQRHDDAPEADLAAPYRDGLQAAIRMQAVAHDLEQQLYVEALRHAEREAEGGGEA